MTEEEARGKRVPQEEEARARRGFSEEEARASLAAPEKAVQVSRVAVAKVPQGTSAAEETEKPAAKERRAREGMEHPEPALV